MQDTTTQPILSDKFFQKCVQLQQIEQSFPIREARKELLRRDTQCEFELLRALTETKKHKQRLRVNSIIENKKNRYPQQSIYQHSRVVLSSNGYINASYIQRTADHTTILTQGPTAGTISDFQSMLVQEKIECVVMLCNMVEDGKARCYDYLTNKELLQFIDNTIELSSVRVEREAQVPYVYRHVFYGGWPDKKTPERKDHVRAIMREISRYSRVVIHCSAGLGRSGVVGGILAVIRQGEAGSVFGAVRKIRERRYGAVQNHQQYKYIYEYFCEE